MIRRGDLHFDFAKRISSVHLARYVSEGVLLAKVSGDFFGNVCDALPRFREISYSAGILAEPHENLRIFFFAGSTQQCDGIDQGLRLASLCQHLRILSMAGIVSAVADDEQRLFPPAAVLQMVQPLTHGIVERGSSPRGDGCESCLKILCIAGKRLPLHKFNRYVIVEVHDEHFILWIARMREGGYGNNDARKLGAHASTVVNNKTHSNGSVAVLEDRQVLELAVLVDTKVLQPESGDECSTRVSYPHRQQDQVGGHGNFRLAVQGGGALRFRSEE